MQNQLPNKWPNCREHFSYSAPCRHKLKMLLHHAAMQELVNRRLIIFIEHIAYGHCRSKRSIGIIMAFYTKALICYSSLLDWLAVNVEFTCPPHHVLCMHFLATHHWSECLHSELFSEFNHARLRAGGHCMSSYTTYVTTDKIDYLSRTHSQSRMMCTCMASGLMTKENE